MITALKYSPVYERGLASIPITGSLVRLKKYSLVLPYDLIVAYDLEQVDDEELSWGAEFVDNEPIALVLNEYKAQKILKQPRRGIFWSNDNFLIILIEDKKRVLVCGDFSERIIEYLGQKDEN